MYITDFVDEYRRWRLAAEKAIAQVPDDQLNRALSPDGNSVAVLMRHVGGNLASRFTDYLASDGEKPWRDRDNEFEPGPFTRAECEALWRKGWAALDAALAPLTDADFDRQVTIRGQAATVHASLTRSIAHIANHCGQLILLARVLAKGEWQWITIPRGKSQEYNRNPTFEKPPSR